MATDDAFLTMEDVLAARRDMNKSAWRNSWRPIVFSVVWGAGAAALFICITCLTGFVDPIKSNRIYWLVGFFSLIFFGSWPIIDFVRVHIFYRRSLAALEARILAGENVLRPNSPLNTDAPTSGAPFS